MHRYLKVSAFLVAFLLAGFAQAHSYALDSVIIPEAELTTARIHSILRDAEFKVSIDDDGDALVVSKGEELWVRGDVEKSRIYLMAYRVFRDNVESGEKLGLVNVINDELVMIRACVTERQDRLWLDYSFPTEAGMTAEQISNTTKRFVSLLATINRKDKGDILK